MAVLPPGAGDGDGEGDEETLPLPHPSRRNRTITGKNRRTRQENLIFNFLPMNKQMPSPVPRLGAENGI
jgi:hypothetical protein